MTQNAEYASDDDEAYQASVKNAKAHAEMGFPCGCDPVRNYQCQYHEGFQDGYDVALTAHIDCSGGKK